jgi:hypothetical protein
MTRTQSSVWNFRIASSRLEPERLPSILTYEMVVDLSNASIKSRVYVQNEKTTLRGTDK